MSSILIPSRRGFLVGLSSALAAPAIVRATNIMRVYPIDLEFAPPPQLPRFGLESFKPPPGVSYMWASASVKGDADLGNLKTMLASGWSAVPASWWSDRFAIEGPTIERGGLLLMQRPIELTEAAMETQVEAVRQQLRGIETEFGYHVAKIGGRSTGFLVRRPDPAQEALEEREFQERYRKLTTQADLEAWLDKGNDDGGTG